MSEETRMVLQLLRDGKISADEAADLLKALSGTPRRAEGLKDNVHQAEVREAARLARQNAKIASRALREELHQVKQISKEAIREAKARLREEREALHKKIDQDPQPGIGALGSLLGSLWGPTQTWENKVTGAFHGADVYKISVHGVNGRVNIEPHSSNEWELNTTTTISALSANEAKQAAPDLYSIAKTDKELTIVAKRIFGQSRTVHFNLRVPSALKYLIDARTTNGSVHIGAVDATELQASTTNGKVVVEASAEEMRLSSTNGSIELLGTTVQANCSTVNGKILVENVNPQAGELDLSTVNGRITIRIKENEGLGLRFTGSTVSGKVSSQLSNQHILHDERKVIGRKLVIETRGEHRQYLNIRAKSVHGAVIISGLREE